MREGERVREEGEDGDILTLSQLTKVYERGGCRGYGRVAVNRLYLSMKPSQVRVGRRRRRRREGERERGKSEVYTVYIYMLQPDSQPDPLRSGQPASKLSDQIATVSSTPARFGAGQIFGKRVSTRFVASRIRSTRFVASRVRSTRFVASRVRSTRFVASRVRSTRFVASRVRSTRFVASRVRSTRFATGVVYRRLAC